MTVPADLYGLCQEAYQNAKAHGFFSNRTLYELVAEIHTEVSEAMEAYRTDYRADLDPLLVNDEGCNGGLDHVCGPGCEPKRIHRAWWQGAPSVSTDNHSFASELADIVIRVMTICGYLGIDLEGEIVKKQMYNKQRPHLHGKRF